MFSVQLVFSMLSLGRILISGLVVANLLMYSLSGMILLYLAAPFLHRRCFWMRYHHFCKDEYSIVTQIKNNNEFSNEIIRSTNINLEHHNSEPVTAVIVMERTSGLSGGVVSQAIQYK